MINFSPFAGSDIEAEETPKIRSVVKKVKKEEKRVKKQEKREKKEEKRKRKEEKRFRKEKSKSSSRALREISPISKRNKDVPDVDFDSDSGDTLAQRIAAQRDRKRSKNGSSDKKSKKNANGDHDQKRSSPERSVEIVKKEYSSPTPPRCVFISFVL